MHFPYTGPHAPSSTTRYWLLQHIPTCICAASIWKALFSITADTNPKYATTSSLNAHEEPSVDASISQTLIKSSASQLRSLWTMWAKSSLGTASFLVPPRALGPNYLYCHLFPSVLIKPVPSSSHLCCSTPSGRVQSDELSIYWINRTTKVRFTSQVSNKRPTKKTVEHSPWIFLTWNTAAEALFTQLTAPPFLQQHLPEAKAAAAEEEVELLFKSTKSAQLLKRLSPKIRL